MKWCALALVGLLAGSIGWFLAPTRAAIAPPHSDWVAHNGGLLSGPSLDRLTAAADPLLKTLHDPRVAVHVLNSSIAGAYSWPDGSIYLTSGLVDRLDSAELSAAVAHELGHLINDRCIATPAALTGRADCDAEARADETGVRLLEQSNLPAAAMPKLLGVVRSLSETPAIVRLALTGRHARLAWLLAKNS